MLFLPLCYFLLSSPFLLIMGRYYRIDTMLLKLVGDHSGAEILLQIFISLVAFSLPTRIISGMINSKNQHGSKRKAQLLPYWFPGARHWADLVFRGENWLKKAR